MGESFYQQVHKVRDGDVLVYQRADTSHGVYQARLKVPGVSGYIVRSLKTRDLRTALNAAEDMYYALKAEQKLGMDVRVSGNLKFKELWKKFYAAHENGLSIHRQRLHKFMANKYFIPFYGGSAGQRHARRLCREILGLAGRHLRDGSLSGIRACAI
jgi:hypothetical protein